MMAGARGCRGGVVGAGRDWAADVGVRRTYRAVLEPEELGDDHEDPIDHACCMCARRRGGGREREREREGGRSGHREN